MRDVINRQGLGLISTYANVDGTEYSDVINAKNNTSTINPGKGDDYIRIYGQKSTVKIHKGEGNDTISTKQELTSGLNLEFDADAQFSFERKDLDLIVTANHSDNVKESVALEHYYGVDFGQTNINMDYYNSYIVQNGSRTSLRSLLSDSVVNVVCGFDHVLYSGSNTSILTGSNGNDIMVADHYIRNKNTTFITGKNGISVMNGEDTCKYIVNSLGKTKNVMQNQNSDTNWDDTLQLNLANINDLYMYFDVNSNSYDNNLYFMTAQQLSSNISNNTFKDPYQINNYKRNIFDANSNYVKVSGLVLEDHFRYFDNGADPGYRKRIGEYYFADGNGNYVKKVNSNNLQTVADTIKGRVNWYVNNQGFSSTQNFLTNVNATINSSTATSAEKTAARNKLNNFINLYKSVKIGTDGNDVFNISSNPSLPNGYANTIYSGKGSDKFNFSGKFGDVNIIADSLQSGSPNTIDTLIFSDAAFEDRTLSTMFETKSYAYSAGNLYFDAKKSGATGSVLYTGFLRNNDTYTKSKNLAIQDKFRKYNVNFVTSANSPADYSADTNNHAVYMKGATTVTLNNKYNFVSSGINDSSSHTINYGFGKDIYMLLGNSNDTYNAARNGRKLMYIEDMSGSDFYNIKINDSSSVVISDTAGTDSLALGGLALDARIYFDINISKNATGSLLICSENNLTKDNVCNKVDAKGVTIDHYFDSSSYKIEGIGFTDMPDGVRIPSMDDWISSIKSSVVSWLNTNDYASTAAVFQSNNQTDINALIACYNNI